MKKIVALLLSLLLVVMSVSALAANSKTIAAAYQTVVNLTGAKTIDNSDEVKKIGEELEKALQGKDNTLPDEVKNLIAGLEGAVLDYQTFTTADGVNSKMNTPANLDRAVTALIGGIQNGSIVAWKKVEIKAGDDIMTAEVKKWLDDNGFTDFVVYIIG